MITISKVTVNNILFQNIKFQHVNDLIIFVKEISGYETDSKSGMEETFPEKKIEELDLFEKLKSLDLKPQTITNYTQALKRIMSWFEIEDLYVLFQDHQKILDVIHEKYENTNTRNKYINALMCVYKCYNLEDQYKKCYEQFKTNCDARPEPNTETKPIEEAELKMDELKTKYELLKCDLIDEYNYDRQNAAVACLFLNHGVLRGAELIGMYIHQNGDCDIANYIDISKSQMVIRDHKTFKKTGVRIIDLCEDFMNLVRPFPNQHFITNKKKETYKDATGFSTRLEALFGSKNYELRKAKSSINLANVDMSVCHNQGHSLQVQMSNYRSHK